MYITLYTFYLDRDLLDMYLSFEWIIITKLSHQ